MIQVVSQSISGISRVNRRIISLRSDVSDRPINAGLSFGKVARAVLAVDLIDSI